jgi:membrane protease subunit HflK
MAWNNQGGPWGGGKSPWGRGSGPSGGGSGGGNRPPDFEEMLRRGQDRMKSILPGGMGPGRTIGLVVAALLVIWGAAGFYVVNPGEIGVNIIFGAYRSQTGPGLHWNPPAPIGHVETPDVATRFRTEIGFRSVGGSSTEVQEESLMLTKDENIIDIKAVVLWRIRAEQVQQYLFEIQDPEDSVKNAVESAIREIIGQSEFQSATTAQRGEIETKAAELAQKMLDSYHAGISIEQVSLQDVGAPQEVIEAFRDVQRASNDAQSSVNEAQAYSNKVLQGAQGQAVQIVKQAEAYKAEKVAAAQGDAQRFLSIYNQYKVNPAITERRLYLETMEHVLGGMNKVLVDPSDKGANAIPYLPLDQLIKKSPPPPIIAPEGKPPAEGVPPQQAPVSTDGSTQSVEPGAGQ